MELFGYPKSDIDKEVPLELDEVTIRASVDTLRRLSEFLRVMADKIEQWGDDAGHAHFEHFDRSQPEHPAFIVMSEGSV